MRLNRPRLAPLEPSEWNDEQRELLTRGNPPRVLNVFATLARHQDLYRRWLPFADHVLFKSSLPPRQREMAILRIGWLCRSGYEFHQHTRIGKASGLSDEERQMVQLLAEGYSTQQIADRLHVSAKTVATHREHVFAKLQIQGIAQLTRFALRAGLSSLEARGP